MYKTFIYNYYYMVWYLSPRAKGRCIAAQLRLLDERQVEELVSTDYEGWFRDVTWSHHSAMGCWIVVERYKNKGGPTCTNHPQVDLCWSMLIYVDLTWPGRYCKTLAKSCKRVQTSNAQKLEIVNRWLPALMCFEARTVHVLVQKAENSIDLLLQNTPHGTVKLWRQ